MHCAPGAQNGGPISDSDGTARLWLEQDKKDLTIQIWREIANIIQIIHSLVAMTLLMNQYYLKA